MNFFSEKLSAYCREMTGFSRKSCRDRSCQKNSPKSAKYLIYTLTKPRAGAIILAANHIKQMGNISKREPPGQLVRKAGPATG